MKLSEIRREVLRIVQDESYNDEVLLNQYANRVQSRLAAEINFPSLKTVGPVTVAAASPTASLVEISSGFSGRLARVYTSLGKARIFATVEEMYDWYIDRGAPTGMDEQGTIEAVAQEGQVLFVYKVPSEETTLTCIAYADAPTLVETTDENNYDESELFPPAYHWEAFVNGICYMIYDEIEDGMEGDKVNTALHFARSFDPNNRNSAVNKIREWLGSTRVHRLTGVWNV